MLCFLGFEWFPRMDVVESGTAYVVTVELPGVNVDGIRVEIDHGRYLWTDCVTHLLIPCFVFWHLVL